MDYRTSVIRFYDCRQALACDYMQSRDIFLGDLRSIHDQLQKLQLGGGGVDGGYVIIYY